MPALPSPGAVQLLKYIFASTGGGPIAHVRTYWSYTGGPPAVSDQVDFGNGVMIDANTNLKGLMHPDWTLDGVEVTDLSSATGAVGVSTHAAIQGTSSTGAALPEETAVCVRYSLTRRYRGGHPKSFWPFGTQGDLDTPLVWGSTFLGEVNTDVAAHETALAMFTSGTTDFSKHVNVSYYEGFTVHTGTTGRARNVQTARSSPVVDQLGAPEALAAVSQQRRRRGKV
jgi:hypothetical protein